MSVAVITGSNGLVGSEAAMHFGRMGMSIIGIDNDMRRRFFGPSASTGWTRNWLADELGADYTHLDIDIRDVDALRASFARFGTAIELVIHAAAQPSHDWAAKQPVTDFEVNALGTLNLLEATRAFAPEATFIFCSSNKVYGDLPNDLPLHELETRWEISKDHTYSDGIREDMPIDQCLHSPFGVSKLSADLMCQEYGRYFGLRTACFRGGTLTGPRHAAAELHGFLAYVMRCAMTDTPYTVFGYKGKQVRDAIHSSDLVHAFEQFYRSPRVAEVYNIGGGRESNVSVIEALEMAGEIADRELSWSYDDSHRVGDHIWWIGSNARFKNHYPDWELAYDVPRILSEIYDQNGDRWSAARVSR